MTTTKQIVATFAENYADVEEEVSLVELKKKLSELYKTISTGKKAKKTEKKVDEEAEPKKKREPTAYNTFMKEQMEILKESGSELNGKEKMQHIAKLWAEKKAEN